MTVPLMAAFKNSSDFFFNLSCENIRKEATERQSFYLLTFPLL